MVTVFFSYSHKDEALRDQLETHLAMLQRQGVISTWHDRRLGAGKDIDAGINAELERAAIVLFLVSADFLASDYCYGVEMKRALERHTSGDARVIPVILRPCDWHHAPFGRLRASPKDGKPITTWTNLDEAFLDATRDIRAAATEIGGDTQQAAAPTAAAPAAPSAPSPAGPRSSNLRLRKTFTDHDRDRFLDEAFAYMARFFDNSIKELAARNGGITGDFKQIDAASFTAAIYRDGKAVARCQVRLGGGFGSNGISFAHGATGPSNAINENLTVETGEQALYLRALMSALRRSEGNLSMEGAAEYYWTLLIEPLQR
ncbi:MAG TPA: toll/interleukin-1 receptor domain-containing protein [Stellaceae bacterium]|nr:toll/interleukin-1 receptor domain-containing protein [Stellaceae bacterium]